MNHIYEDVPGIGRVQLTHHAQRRMAEAGISEAQFKAALFKGEEIPDGFRFVKRELNRVRVTINMQPEHYTGYAVVVTVTLMSPALRQTPRSR